MTTYPDDVVEKAQKAFDEYMIKAFEPTRHSSWPLDQKAIRNGAWQAGLASAEAAMWRPIETAPKDGTPIILLYDLPGLSDYHARIVICHWSKNCGGRWVFNQRAAFGYSTKYQPKLWAPLPTPPAAYSSRS